MKRIVNEFVPEGLISLHDVSDRDVVMVGTSLWTSRDQDVYDVIIIGTIQEGKDLKGLMYCNIDYSKMKMEDFKIVPNPFNISVSVIEEGLSHNQIRAYIIIDIQDIREAMADILNWHQFPEYVSN